MFHLFSLYLLDDFDTEKHGVSFYGLSMKLVNWLGELEIELVLHYCALKREQSSNPFWNYNGRIIRDGLISFNCSNFFSLANGILCRVSRDLPVCPLCMLIHYCIFLT